jgi:DNA-binding response OmpR family regulator
VFGGSFELSRILVLDDDVAIRRFVGERLAAHGHEVAGADVSWTAVEDFRSFDPDIVLCDTDLVGQRSLAIVQALSGCNPRVRLVGLDRDGWPDDRSLCGGGLAHVA